MKALVYANGSSIIGLGHIMRTLAISSELCKRKVLVEYVVDKSDENAIKLIKNSGFNVVIINNVLEYISSFINKYDVSLIDSYDINEYEVEKFYVVSRKVVYIDDLALFNSYNMDILINTSIEALNLKYVGDSKKLLGPKYAILRDEFKNIQYKMPREKVKKVLITLGGGDINNVTKLVLDLLLDYFKDKDIEYNVVLGNSYRYKDFMLTNYKKEKINFHINVNNMRNIMMQNNLAISAGGNTLYELCACGVPTISIITSENQRQFVKEIHKKTGISFVDLTQIDTNKTKYFKSIIDNYIESYELRKHISMEMFELVDGKGCSRIVDEIMKLL